jgi:hypothetical protein
VTPIVCTDGRHVVVLCMYWYGTSYMTDSRCDVMLCYVTSCVLIGAAEGKVSRCTKGEREGGRIPAATRCTCQHVPACPVDPILFPAASSPPTLRASSHRHHCLSRLQPHLKSPLLNCSTSYSLINPCSSPPFTGSQLQQSNAHAVMRLPPAPL